MIENVSGQLFLSGGPVNVALEPQDLDRLRCCEVTRPRPSAGTSAYRQPIPALDAFRAPYRKRLRQLSGIRYDVAGVIMIGSGHRVFAYEKNPENPRRCRPDGRIQSTTAQPFSGQIFTISITVGGYRFSRDVPERPRSQWRETLLQ